MTTQFILFVRSISEKLWFALVVVSLIVFSLLICASPASSSAFVAVGVGATSVVLVDIAFVIVEGL